MEAHTQKPQTVSFQKSYSKICPWFVFFLSIMGHFSKMDFKLYNMNFTYNSYSWGINSLLFVFFLLVDLTMKLKVFIKTLSLENISTSGQLSIK